jgi:hypothetical protein
MIDEFIIRLTSMMFFKTTNPPEAEKLKKFRDLCDEKMIIIILCKVVEIGFYPVQ